MSSDEELDEQISQSPPRTPESNDREIDDEENEEDEEEEDMVKLDNTDLNYVVEEEEEEGEVKDGDVAEEEVEAKKLDLFSQSTNDEGMCTNSGNDVELEEGEIVDDSDGCEDASKLVSSSQHSSVPPTITSSIKSVPVSSSGVAFPNYSSTTSITSSSVELPQTKNGNVASGYKQREKTEVCRFYLRGICKNGDSCRFLHSGKTERSRIQIVSTSPASTFIIGAGKMPIFYNNITTSIPPPTGPPISLLSAVFAPPPSASLLTHPPPPPPTAPPPPTSTESAAWMEGLKKARELVRRQKGGEVLAEEKPSEDVDDARDSLSPPLVSVSPTPLPFTAFSNSSLESSNFPSFVQNRRPLSSRVVVEAVSVVGAQQQKSSAKGIPSLIEGILEHPAKESSYYEGKLRGAERVSKSFTGQQRRTLSSGGGSNFSDPWARSTATRNYERYSDKRRNDASTLRERTSRRRPRSSSSNSSSGKDEKRNRSSPRPLSHDVLHKQRKLHHNDDECNKVKHRQQQNHSTSFVFKEHQRDKFGSGNAQSLKRKAREASDEEEESERGQQEKREGSIEEEGEEEEDRFKKDGGDTAKRKSQRNISERSSVSSVSASRRSRKSSRRELVHGSSFGGAKGNSSSRSSSRGSSFSSARCSSPKVQTATLGALLTSSSEPKDRRVEKGPRTPPMSDWPVSRNSSASAGSDAENSGSRAQRLPSKHTSAAGSRRSTGSSFERKQTNSRRQSQTFRSRESDEREDAPPAAYRRLTPRKNSTESVGQNRTEKIGQKNRSSSSSSSSDTSSPSSSSSSDSSSETEINIELRNIKKRLLERTGKEFESQNFETTSSSAAIISSSLKESPPEVASLEEMAREISSAESDFEDNGDVGGSKQGKAKNDGIKRELSDEFDGGFSEDVFHKKNQYNKNVAAVKIVNIKSETISIKNAKEMPDFGAQQQNNISIGSGCGKSGVTNYNDLERKESFDASHSFSSLNETSGNIDNSDGGKKMMNMVDREQKNAPKETNRKRREQLLQRLQNVEQAIARQKELKSGRAASTSSSSARDCEMAVKKVSSSSHCSSSSG